MEVIKKKDFIELKFTGYANGEPFDSNILEDLKKIDPNAQPNKTIVIVGERMIVKGFDESLDEKEIGKKYEIKVLPKDGFGERKRELVKTIPLKVFTEQKINPIPGATFALDNMIVRIITVSGARVITDFNHPLAGKELNYKFTIVRKVIDDKEKSEAFFEFFFRIIPDFEITDKVTIKAQKQMEGLVNLFKDKFKDLIGKELFFEPTSSQETKKEHPKTV